MSSCLKSHLTPNLIDKFSATACGRTRQNFVMYQICHHARLTKTRVCLSCFGSTNSGHAAFHQDPDLFKLLRLYKSRAPCKFSILGRPSQRYVLCLLSAPPFHPLIFIVLAHLGSYDCCLSHRVRTPLIRCASPMSSTSRLSHPFHLPVPRNSEFVAAANLFLNLVFVRMQVMACPCDYACHLCVAD